MTKQMAYTNFGVIDLAKHLMEENEKQLVLPQSLRKYLCVRIVDAKSQHAALIKETLEKENGVLVKDYHCLETRNPLMPLTLGSNYSGLTKIKKKDKYIVVYEECKTREHHDFDLEVVKIHKEEKGEYLGTIILTPVEKYKSSAPEEVFDKVEEYYFTENDEPDMYIG